jgi:hypothetical protein
VKIGDLVTKIRGWGKEAKFIGIILGTRQGTTGEMLIVFSEGEIEHWHKIFTRLHHEDR